MGKLKQKAMYIKKYFFIILLIKQLYCIIITYPDGKRVFAYGKQIPFFVYQSCLLFI